MARSGHVLVAAFLFCLPAFAQETEPGIAAGDTAVAPVEMPRALRGRALSDSLPALRPDVDLVELLAGQAGSFTYLFDRPGWPDGWSPYGLSPNTRPLSFNGIPFSHIFTGRPAYKLVPFTFVEAPRLEIGRFGSPYGVLTQLRSFVSAVPVTEGTYWRGGDGLQSIDAAHAQHRRRSLFGRPGFLNVMGSYSGRATDVDYPGSDLTRGRRVQLRLRYEQLNWSFEVLNMHNRRRIGAHHGVLPLGGDFNSIYRDDLAQVERPEAERRVVRNDLLATLRLRGAAAAASTVTGYWSAETFRYRDASDTLQAGSDRAGLFVEQPLATSERHRLAAYVEAWSERVEPAGHFEGDARQRRRLHAYLRDSLAVGSWSAAAEAGWAAGDGAGPTASLSISRRAGAFDGTAEISTSHPGAAVIYASGFGTLRGSSGSEAGRMTGARLEAAFRLGAVDAALGLFGHRAADPLEVFAAGDSAAVLQAPSSFTRVGAYGVLGWRRGARRGFYAHVAPTVTRFLDEDRSELHRRTADVLPIFFGRARLGARYRIFQGDLDFDVYLEGTAWSDLSSRTLHPQSGLLLVPEASSLVLGASNRIDLVAEIRVRDAKFFLVYDNLFAGTSLLPGSLLVPVYPLPAQRFRLGLYWPIFG